MEQNSKMLSNHSNENEQGAAMRKRRLLYACLAMISIKSLAKESFGFQGTTRQQQEHMWIKFTMGTWLIFLAKMIPELQMQLKIIGDFKGKYRNTSFFQSKMESHSYNKIHSKDLFFRFSAAGVSHEKSVSTKAKLRKVNLT